MMRWIIGSSLKFRRLLIALAVGAVILGITQAQTVPMDILPEFTAPTVEVQTEALGLSAAEVEQLITVPLEQDLLNGVAFLDEIHSASLPGLSSVVMTFEPGTDLLDARQVVAERLTQAVGVAGLPEVAKPPQMLQPLSSTSRVAMVKLSSDELSPIEMSLLARWVISPRLQGVPGVANVAIWGHRDRQLQAQVDPERLRENGVSLQDVIRTTGNALEVSPLSFLEASSPGTGGFIDTLNQRLHIFHEQAITSEEELKQIPVEGPNGQPIRVDGRALTLGDVSEVVEDHQPLIGDALCADEQCLLLVVEKFPHANVVDVTKEIDAAFEALRPGLPGMQVDTSVYRPAAFIESSFANLGGALLIGAVLLLLILGAVLWDWRRALIGAVAIIVSLSVAGLVLYLSGVTVNTMILAGLVMGLVVIIDDAIIDPDNVVTRLRRRRTEGRGTPVWETIIAASLQMRSATLYAGLIVVAALLPVFFMDGAPGAFLPQIALTYALAVGAAMLVALTLVPGLSMMLLANAPERGESPVAQAIHRMYDRLSGRMAHRRGPAFIAFAILLVMGLAALPLIDTSMRPALKERDVIVQLTAETGTSLPKMNSITADAVEQLGALQGVRNVSAHVGRAVMSDQVVNVNRSEIWISIDPAASYDGTRARIDGVMDAIVDDSNLSEELVTYSQKRVTDVLEQNPEEIVVRVYGEDAAIREAKAEDVRAAMAGIPGIDEPRVQLPAQEPTVQVRVDLERAQVAGIKPGDVRRAAATLLSGMTVGHLFEEQKVFDVVVWGAPHIRENADDVKQLLIETPGGGYVRLEDVATVETLPRPAVIRHESVASYLDITAGVEGRDVAAVAADVERALQTIQFPLEHHAEVLGGFAERQATRSQAISVAVAAAIVILLLLQAAYSRWGLALLSFLTLPVAISGGLLGSVATGRLVSLGSIAGFVAVLGVAARWQIQLITHYQQLEREGGDGFTPQLVLQGTRDRLMPIVLTTVGALAVFLPLALSGGRAGLEIVGPMAVIIVGGVVTSAILALFITPGAYLAYRMRFGFPSEPERFDEELDTSMPAMDEVQGLEGTR